MPLELSYRPIPDIYVPYFSAIKRIDVNLASVRERRYKPMPIACEEGSIIDSSDTVTFCSAKRTEEPTREVELHDERIRAPARRVKKYGIHVHPVIATESYRMSGNEGLKFPDPLSCGREDVESGQI